MKSFMKKIIKRISLDLKTVLELYFKTMFTKHSLEQYLSTKFLPNLSGLRFCFLRNS